MRDRFKPLARGLNAAPAVIAPASKSVLLDEAIKAVHSPKASDEEVAQD